MTEFVITVQDESKVDFFLKLLRLFDFIQVDLKLNQLEESAISGWPE